MMYEEITASSLIKVDLDGTILAKPDYGDLDYGINKAGYLGVHGGSFFGLRPAAADADGHAFPEDRLSRLPGRGAGFEGTSLPAARPGPGRSADPAQPRRADRRQDGGRSLQLDAPAGTGMPRAIGGDGHRRAPAGGQSGGAGRNLE
ncbi:hypothetical protein G6F35_017183 [Rhizopus arrhizus]|nr:hypothetical protein G6F35_017183 [Rhizopus arrhizus]